MTLIPLTRLVILSVLFFTTLHSDLQDKSIFISPLKIPLFLSSNFGELRVAHFHSGLDIKTQGVSGKEVVASASGYIFRISVSPGGFGKALYIRHPSGYSTVYAHLDKFTPEIEYYVKTRQYEKKSYLITIFPERETFPVTQGELIAYSGNSGGSAGPHLHFEIRKSDSEIPVNPLLFNFDIKDDIKPVIEKLAIFPINNRTLINNRNKIEAIDVYGDNGSYYLAEDNEIRITGLAGFGIKSFDQLNDSNNKCAVYSIELTIDSNTIFKYVMDGFSFNDTRFVNSHIDYETYMKENIYIERTFVLPNDKLNVYQNIVNRGIFNFKDNSTNHVEITVTDVYNNTSHLSFIVKTQSEKSEDVIELKDKTIKIMPFNSSNRFVSENLSISIPEGALYDTLYFSYNISQGTKEMLSDLHNVHNKYTPVHEAYQLSIKPSIIPPGKESKMLIVQLGDDLKQTAIISSWKEGYLTAEVLSFGNFYIGIDTVAPVITATGMTSGVNLTGKEELRIKITDDFSGIKSYEPFIDGKWTLFEYDQKDNLLIYKFDEQRITKGSNHSLSLKVTDNKDNVSLYSCDFMW